MFDKICLILSIIGCLNWGLVGLFQFDPCCLGIRRSHSHYQPNRLHSHCPCRYLVHFPAFQRKRSYSKRIT